MEILHYPSSPPSTHNQHQISWSPHPFNMVKVNFHGIVNSFRRCGFITAITRELDGHAFRMELSSVPWPKWSPHPWSIDMMWSSFLGHFERFSKGCNWEDSFNVIRAIQGGNNSSSISGLIANIKHLITNPTFFFFRYVNKK